MLNDYGQCTMVSVRSEINISGYFKYYEETGKGTVTFTVIGNDNSVIW